MTNKWKQYITLDGMYENIVFLYSIRTIHTQRILTTRRATGRLLGLQCRNTVLRYSASWKDGLTSGNDTPVLFSATNSPRHRCGSTPVGLRWSPMDIDRAQWSEPKRSSTATARPPPLFPGCATHSRPDCTTAAKATPGHAAWRSRIGRTETTRCKQQQQQRVDLQ